MKFEQYDEVRLKKLHVPLTESVDEFNLRLPVLGDVATIVEIYSKPPGYELECSDSNGTHHMYAAAMLATHAKNERTSQIAWCAHSEPWL